MYSLDFDDQGQGNSKRETAPLWDRKIEINGRRAAKWSKKIVASSQRKGEGGGVTEAGGGWGEGTLRGEAGHSHFKERQRKRGGGRGPLRKG